MDVNELSIYYIKIWQCSLKIVKMVYCYMWCTTRLFFALFCLDRAGCCVCRIANVLSTGKQDRRAPSGAANFAIKKTHSLL